MKQLKYLLTVFLAVTAFCDTLADDIPYRQQRREIFWQLPVNENSIVFLGDSITDFGLWSEFFGSDGNIINRGIQGIESAEVLNHLSLIYNGHPRKVFLMIGINDFHTPEHVVPNIRKILETFRRESPETELYVQSILPCNNAARTDIPVALNPQIKDLCNELNVTYIDIFGEMTRISGSISMPENMTDDGLHPNGPGYREWCKILAPYVGKSSSISETIVPDKPLKRAIFNSILTEFQLLPVNDCDILHIGDYQVMTGEWSELMGEPKFKNRGLGGGFGWSLSLEEFNASYNCFIKGCPSKIFFHCGKRALDAEEASADSLFIQYQTAITNIRNAAPDAEIYLESLIPNTNPSINARYICPFNKMIANYVAEDTSGRLHYVDIYNALAENGTLASRFRGANTEQSRGINGHGYVAWANVLKEFVK